MRAGYEEVRNNYNLSPLKYKATDEKVNRILKNFNIR